MAYINIATSNKVLKDGSGKILEGTGNFDSELSIYYAEDIKVVLGGEEKKLEFLNIIIQQSKFANDGELHLTVLAIKDPTSPLGYFEKVAGPWPPFYHQTNLPKPGEEVTDSDL